MTEAASHRWSSKSIGGKAGHIFFNMLVRMGAVWPANLTLFFVVLWYSLLPSVRARALPYLSRRFPTHGALSRWLDCFRLNYSFGTVLLDRMIFRILGRGEILAQQGDNNRILELLAEGHGLIVLSAHVGCWQTGMAGLAFARVPISVVLLQEAGNVDRHFFEHDGQGPQVNVIDPAGPFGGMLDMLKALKRNEIVCVMGDRYLPEDSNVLEVPFLGEDAKMPIFPFSVASAAGAPVAVMVTLREGPCVARAHVLDVFSVPSGIGKRADACLPYVQRYANTLERLTWLCPFQFFNFFDMWK